MLNVDGGKKMSFDEHPLSHEEWENLVSVEGI